jgi:cation diffusion facilitator family transporter
VSQNSGVKAVLAAMVANISIAILKLVAWLLTGAASMLAEAVHSVADSANQILLLLGGKAAKKRPTTAHPFGYGRDRYISAFLVAIILFSMGGLFACYEAFNKFKEVREGHPNALLTSAWWWVPVAVLVGAIIAESLSLRTAIRETRAVKGNASLFRFIRSSKAPELPVILLEDLGALTGLVFALVGVGMTLLTGSGYWDAAGTAAIGLLLVAIAIILAIETKSMLIGESASEEEIAKITAAFEATPGIKRIIYMKTVHFGPDEVMVAVKVCVDPELRAGELSDVIDAAEAAVRAASPIVKAIYVEPDTNEDDLEDAIREDTSR